MEQMEYSSSSTYSQKMLHSIHYSSIPPLPIPKNYQKECVLDGLWTLFRNRMIFVPFELEQVEFRILIPGIPLPEKSQKESGLKGVNGTKPIQNSKARK